MSTVQIRTHTAAARDTASIAVEAYVFLYPLVLMEITRRQMTNLPGGMRPGVGPMGAFAHVREFPPAEFKAVVRPNFDTLYSPAWLDLEAEPVIITVPDTDGRYYLLPILDMWTDAFAVPGKRTTGTRAAHFLLAAPGWDGAVPNGVERIDAPTRCVWAIGRIQTNGPADYPAVRELQDGFSITPLSRWGTTPAPVHARTDLTVDMETPPLDQVNRMPAREFFTLAAGLLAIHAPHGTDWSTVARMRRIGLHPGERFDYDALDASARSAVDEAPALALGHMQATLPRLARVVNGWQMNTDSIGFYGNFYPKRAIVAMVGLGPNPPEGAISPLCTTAAAVQALDEAPDWVLPFDERDRPPVGAFWSVTMYDAD